MRSRVTTAVVAAWVAALLAAGCGDDGTGAAPATTAASGARLDGSITVAAATSLTAAFAELADDFAHANPGVEVTLTFDASSTLVTQILEGAPADVVASADEANMAALVDEGLLAGPPQVFATNELAIVTRPGNPEGIESLADLVDAGVISLCGEEVPCGRYAAEALESAGVALPESNVTRGQNVGATLTAATQGDAVAAIVYVTDARAAGDAVEPVAIPPEHNVVATYPIGVLAASDRRVVADAFVAHVHSADGQAVLRDHGFLPPA